MAVGRLPKKVGGSVIGLAALGALATGVEPAGAATETARYRRSDQFEVTAPSGTVTCQINGQLTTYDDGTVFAYVGRSLVEGASNACEQGRVHIEITYDPDPSDAATKTITIHGSGNEVYARGVPAPNFIRSQHTVFWQYDDREPLQTAGPYRLPK